MSAPAPITIAPTLGRLRRVCVDLRGAVQGVGFRPFVHRLANELALRGWIRNTAQGLKIDVEGHETRVERFLLRLERDRPEHSYIQSLETTYLDPCGHPDFRILESVPGGDVTGVILPDIATCPSCLTEVFDPSNRRYRYPFTNCTHCGPRYSIIEELPYDRAHTSMRRFSMCSACQSEYLDPADRRFHAQPNACPVCGPEVELWQAGGQFVSRSNQALADTIQALREEQIVAVKGLGGFQLLVRASADLAVRRLRDRKHREAKPLAVMMPNLDHARRVCDVSPAEARLLCSAQAPIVLLRRLPNAPADGIAPSVAPGNPYLGVMLPYTPLHHLLLHDLDEALVATSGNLSEEPICTDEREALKRLAGIADLYLVHNRPIVRHVDDSVARIMLGREMLLRRARGYAPLPIDLEEELPCSIGVGAHFKNTIAFARGQQVILSQHIGDLATPASKRAFEQVVRDLTRIQHHTPTIAAADSHPDYLSSREAEKLAPTVLSVQHHLAHVLACMAENHVHEPLLGVAWDGTGFGEDGTIWGGEFIRIAGRKHERVAHLRHFPLPGGERAVFEPRRVAMGLLYTIYGEETFAMKELPPIRAFAAKDLKALKSMVRQTINTPLTSSAGRLFDAVASLLDLRHESKFEGQAAMEVEFAAEDTDPDETYPYQLIPSDTFPWRLDWEPMIRRMVEELLMKVPAWEMASRFHNTLAAMIVDVARHSGEPRVVLSGGCFQNKCLTERTVRALRGAGLHPYWHQRVPPNDGGIALGQVVATRMSLS